MEHKYENVFSPEGTLLQVEYALEAAKKGMACVTLVGGDSIVAAASKRLSEKLVLPESLTSFFKASSGLFCTISGLPSDVQHTVGEVKREAAKTVYDFGFCAKPDIVCRRIADSWQKQTQKSAERLDAVSVALFGYDNGKPKVFFSDASGAIFSFRAVAFGEGGAMVQKKLEKIYKDGESLEDAIDTALSSLSEALGADYLATDIEVVYIKEGMKDLTHLTVDEIDSALVRIAEKD